MPPRPISVLIAINLIVGNGILRFTELGPLLTSFIGGSHSTKEEFLLHAICSAIASLSILFTARLIKLKRRNLTTLAILALAGSVSVPFVSTYLLFAGYELILGRLTLHGPQLYVAILATSESFLCWFPFVIVNTTGFWIFNHNLKLSANKWTCT